MKVFVKLFSILRRDRFDEEAVEVAVGATVDDLLLLLGLKQHEVGAVYVNGRDGVFGQTLADGDQISLLPSLDGG